MCRSRHGLSSSGISDVHPTSWPTVCRKSEYVPDARPVSRSRVSASLAIAKLSPFAIRQFYLPGPARAPASSSYRVLSQALEPPGGAHSREPGLPLSGRASRRNPRRPRGNSEFVFRRIQGREENDRNLGKLRVCLEPRTHFITIHFWHVDVQQNQIRRILHRRRQCCRPSGNEFTS